MDLRREINAASLALERYRIETYTKIEISTVDRENGAILIKPRESLDFQEFHPDRAESCIARLHAEIYRRFTEMSSVLIINSEWIRIASGAGWVLDRASYGYIPSFNDTVPCTAKIRTPPDAADFPKSFCDAVDNVSPQGRLPRAALVRSNGAVIFAHSPMDAAEYAVTLEYAAKKAFHIRKFR